MIGAQDCAVAVVLDGHNGYETADFAADLLHVRLQHVELTATHGNACPAKAALQEAELALVAEDFVCGATATAVVATSSWIHVAWLGDSTAVGLKLDPEGDLKVGTNRAVAVELTTMHRPDLESEQGRIAAAGGLISRMTRMMDDGNEYPYGPHRVYTADGKAGGLTVSRALGDTAFKPVVSGEPDSTKVEREDYTLLIVATDGLWDVISPAEACQLALDCTAAGRGDSAGEQLVDAALDRGSQDNVTAAVLYLQ